MVKDCFKWERAAQLRTSVWVQSPSLFNLFVATMRQLLLISINKGLYTTGAFARAGLNACPIAEQGGPIAQHSGIL